MDISKFTLCVLLLLNANLNSQGPIPIESGGVLNAIGIEQHIPTKRVIPYEFVREADVTWSNRIWRVIDLREKFNHPLYYPMDKVDVDFGIWFKNGTRHSLWTIIRQHILLGDLTLYSPYHPQAYYMLDGDQFKYPIISNVNGGNYYNDQEFKVNLIEYLGYLGTEDDTPLTDDNGDPIIIYDITTNEPSFTYATRDTFYWESKDIIQYKLKEDWYFDKERSVMDVRIIGIAPVKYIRENNDPKGAIIGTKEMFWLYFPECRYVFQNYFVQSSHNDSQRLSFDDLFWKRMFQSYIVKESNIYNRDIESYRSGIDALMESNQIKEKIFKLEHDLWSL